MSFEYKFSINKDQYEQLKKFCLIHGNLDPHCHEANTYDITSIYKFYIKSKTDIKKIRLRKYKHNHGIDYFLEQKRKSKKGIDKKRIQIDENQFNDLCYCANQDEFLMYLRKLHFEFDCTDMQVSSFNTYKLYYTREPWLVNYKGFSYRLTFDTELQTTFCNTNIFLKQNECIFEIKGSENPDLIITDIMNKYQISPIKISKYKLAKIKFNNLKKE